VSLSAVDLTPISDADVDVPSISSELLDALDTSLTPKAESLSGGDDCSTTLMEETADGVIATGGAVTDVKPLSPPSDESYDGCAADNAGEQIVDVADDQFFPASEGELFHSVITSRCFVSCQARISLCSASPLGCQHLLLNAMLRHHCC